MDKKNLLLGITCLGLAFFVMSYQEAELRKAASSRAAQVENVRPTEEKVLEEMPKDVIVDSYKSAQEELYTLENKHIRVVFTNFGGAIRCAHLKDYPAKLGSSEVFEFNEYADSPALSLSWSNASDGQLMAFKKVQANDKFIQFVTKLEDGTQIVRGYRLADDDAENPYLINHEIAVRQPTFLHRTLYVNLGMFPATSGDDRQESLNFGAYDGKEAEFVNIRDFESSRGFLGMGKNEAKSSVQARKFLQWGSIKNQFFTAILTPEFPAIGYVAFPGKFLQNNQLTYCIRGRLLLDIPSTDSILKMNYYVGPKDYLLLNKMGGDQDLVMQFGFFGGISKILLMSMRSIHSVIPNWGLTIIVLTIIIKLLMWPITQAQLRSSKRMAGIQTPLKEIREKYKNNPQKMQTETMKLFKEHRVNPASGCLPIFIQLPIFFGLFVMLRTSSELRFQSFLWIKDLSIADTIAYVGSFPINILPLLMGLTMFFQMRLTPTPTMDGMQQKIISAMPFIFLLFCYTFPAALVLYWTVQNLFSILQQWLTNRSREQDVLKPATLNK